MNTQDERFLHAVLGYGNDRDDFRAGVAFRSRLDRAVASSGRDWYGRDVREWSHGAQSGLRLATGTTDYAAATGAPWPTTTLVLVACWGGTLPGVEISAGLSLVLPDVDFEKVHHRANAAMRIGQIYAPETAPATKGTVQIGFAEHLADGTAPFGLVKLRARVIHAVHGHHVMRFIREMPAGWPENGIEERPEAAFTGRTAAVPSPASIELAIPILTPTLTHTERFGVSRLEKMVATLRAAAA